MSKFGKKDNRWFLSRDGVYCESQFAPWDDKRDTEDLPIFIDNPTISFVLSSDTEAIALFYGEYYDVTIFDVIEPDVENCRCPVNDIHRLLLPENITIEDANRCITDRKFLAELYLKNKNDEKEQAREYDLLLELLDKIREKKRFGWVPYVKLNLRGTSGR